MSRDHILAVDIGSSSMKLGLFGTDGELIHLDKLSYPFNGGIMGSSVDPGIFWRLLCRMLLTAAPLLNKDTVLVISIDGPARSNFILDSSGIPLTDCLTWADSSLKGVEAELNDLFKKEELYNAWGFSYPLSPTLPFVRLAHFYKSVLFPGKKEGVFTTPKDYLVYKLTGKMTSDPASMISLYNARTKNPVNALLKKLSIPGDILPVLKEPWEISGSVSSSASKETGLAEGIPVAAGTVDSMANSLGCGIVTNERLLDISGTTEVILAATPYRDCFTHGLSLLPQINGQYLAGGPMQSGGLTLQWWRDCFQDNEKSQEILPLVENEVLFLPYLNGERVPIWDPDARGVYAGIRLSDKRINLRQAVMEGIAFNIKRIKILLEGCINNEFRELVVTGGGGNNESWNIIKASFLEMPVCVPRIPETALAGAALLGLMSLNTGKTINEIFPDSWKDVVRYNPVKAISSHYRKLFHRYLELDNRLAGFSKSWR